MANQFIKYIVNGWDYFHRNRAEAALKECNGMQRNDWLEIPTAALVHRSELPPMTAEQEQHFAARLAERLGAYLPSGAEWLEEVQTALDECEITTKENASV